MTLLFMDGFHGGDITSKWNSGSAGTRGTGSPRFAGGAYISNVTAAKSFTAAGEVFVAGALYPAQAAAAYNTLVLRGDSGATTHLTVMRNDTSGFLEVRRGTTAGTLLATGTTVIPLSQWTHLQVRATIADSGGIVQVRINGAATADISFTGDTKNAGTNTTIDQLALSTYNTSSSWTDVAILNTAGSVNNTWPGDCRIVTLTPAGNGGTSQGVGSDADSTNNYLLVDETPYSATDYVGMTTAGNGDTYAMSDLPAGATAVMAVQVNLNVAKSDAGVAAMKRRVRSGGTTYTGATITLGTTYATVSEILETDPATTAAWTPTNVNAVEAGFEAA